MFIIVFAGKGVPHKHGTPLSVLQIIPLDLVRVHVQVEAAAIAGINGGILRLVGVVYHAILAVLDVGMYFDIVVRAEPLVQVGLIVGSPQNSAVQHAVVHKAVGQAADVHAAALAILVRGHLHFLVALNQNLGAFQRKDALLPLAEVHVMVGAVGQNKVVTVLVPVVLVVVKREAGFFLHAERCGQLQIAPLILVTAGFADTDQTAAAMDKALDGGGNIRVLPDLAAGVGGVAVADVDEDVDAVQHLRVGFDIVKADKPHIKRCAGQRFDHARIAVILLLVQRMVDHVAAPRALLPPAVQHSHSLDAVGRGALDVLVQFAELVADALDIVEELRELAGQFQIAAVADAVNGLAQDGAACGDPVFLGFAHRVAALVKVSGKK